MAGTKKYGLIIKKTTKEKPLTKISVFGNDSSDEEKAAKSNINVSLMREAEKKKQMKQTQIEMEKALKEDPTVYEYDNIYDEMAEKKKAVIPKLAEKDKEPKYIKQLLESAKSRKMEDERRMERKVHKEREQEGGEFQDKEEFVTSAYRKRVVELEEEEKQLKKKEALDAANDVTKRSDLSMFYSNLLQQNVSMGGVFTVDGQNENREADDEGSKTTDNSQKDNNDKSQHESRDSHHKEENHERPRRDREASGSRHRDSGERRKDYESRRRRSSSEERSYRKRRESRRESDSSSHRTSERRRDPESPRKHDRSDDQKRESRDENSPEREEKNIHERNELETVKTDTKSDQESDKSSKFSKRSTNETVSSARERFLERKRARREMMIEQKPKDDSDED